MTDLIEMGTVSSRGQICIPNNIREEMGLAEGNKVIFLVQNDTLLIKKVRPQTFAEITAPLKEAMKKSGMKETEVVDMIHRMRAEKRKKSS